MANLNGRPAGIPNKLTGEIKESFVKAFHYIQNDERAKLQTWAAENPDKFYPLISKLFPLEVTGAGGAPLSVQIIRFSPDEK